MLDAAEAVARWDWGWEKQHGDDLQPARPEDRTHRGVHLPHLQYPSGCASPTSAAPIGVCISHLNLELRRKNPSLDPSWANRAKTSIPNAE